MTFATSMLLASTLSFTFGTGISQVEVQGNQVIAHVVTAPSGYEAIVAVTFEDPTTPGGLTPQSLDFAAIEVNPTDPTLRSRLPSGLFVPARFPVMITVNQGTVPGQEAVFNGSYAVELLTSHLDFRANSPWRLLKAPDGGAFEDISRSIGLGSYRALGKSGSFSEFVIAADLRPQTSSIGGKIQSVRDLIDANNGGDIDPNTYAILDILLESVKTAFESGDYVVALQRARILAETVEAEAAADRIDNTYTGGADVSLAGVLLGKIESTKFSLELARLEENDRTEILETGFSTTSGFTGILRVLFTGAQALELDSVNVTAEEIDPNDPILLGRLPAGVQIPSEFPVLIHVDPGSNVEQVFRADIEIEVETEDLDFFGDTLLRLFKAPDGGAFTDITETYGLGSYRALGKSGSFSELMIVRDLRPSTLVLTTKFVNLREILLAHQGDINPPIYSALELLLDEAETAYLQNNLSLALTKIEAFLTSVKNSSGQGIPDIWVSTSGASRVNVAAKLTSAGETVRFSLVVASNPAADPADVNRDGVVDSADVFYVINRVFPGS